MRKQLFIFALLLCSIGAIGQESRDYFSSLEQYNHAQALYDNQLYPAAYDLFTELIEQEEQESLFASEKMINAKLYRALSATLSDQQIGIPLVLQFMENYPNHPNRSVANLELGKYYANNREFDNALDQFSQVSPSALTPAQLLDFNMNAGYTYFIKKKFLQAEHYLQPVATRPSAVQQDATYYLGLSQYFQGDYENALRNLRLVENHTKYGEEIPYYFARIAFEQKKYDEVIAYQGKSSNPEFNQIIGQSYFNLERYQEALPYLEKFSATANKQSPEALYQLAYTQYQLGQYDKAISNFEQLNIVDNEVGQYALYALAESYLKQNDKEKALQAYSRAAKINYNQKIQENASFAEAKLSYELGRNNDAIELIQNFIEQYPQSAYRAEADQYLVDLFLNSTNYVDALAILEKMDNRSAKMNEAYQKVAYLRAVELYQASDLGQSKVLLDKVIDNNYDKRYTALANYWLGEMAYEYNRYPLAISYLQKFINSSVNKPAQYTSQANYTMGYANYRQKKYREAANYFSKVETGNFINDASLRLGDSYFINKNYSGATQAYQKVRSGSALENDYAKYQLAILKGLQGNKSAKSNQLKQLYTNSPKSAYADDALYEHGRMALTQENYYTAKNRFESLLNKYPRSEKVKEAYNQLGLLHFNQTQYDESLKNYDKVVRNYPNTDEASSALQAIQEIYIEQGNPNGYFAYLKTVDGVSVDDNEQERITYAAAETQFKNANCTQAVSGFSNYLVQYPRGFYAANAHFYRGECLNQSGDQAKAIDDFRAVAKMPTNKFTERSFIRVARYNYREDNYVEAVSDYKSLEELATENESIYTEEVNIGLMQAYNRIKTQRELAYTYAAKVLAQTQVDASITNEAEFLQAIQKFDTGDQSNAYIALDRVAAKMRDQWGAEARYTMALILHNQKQYDRSTTAAYRVADETPAEDDWVARSFILVAKNYEGQDEIFQAKATVESVIENYTGGDQSIINEANELLNRLKRIESNNSNLLPTQNNSNQLQLKEN